MQRVYKLGFAAVPATSDRNFLWILEPLTEQAYSRARGGLQKSWRDGLLSESDRRELFTFRDAQSSLAHILADLGAAEIDQDEVEVVGDPALIF
jgi:hypothetical protein